MEDSTLLAPILSHQDDTCSRHAIYRQFAYIECDMGDATPASAENFLEGMGLQANRFENGTCVFHYAYTDEAALDYVQCPPSQQKQERLEAFVAAVQTTDETHDLFSFYVLRAGSALVRDGLTVLLTLTKIQKSLARLMLKWWPHLGASKIEMIDCDWLDELAKVRSLVDSVDNLG